MCEAYICQSIRVKQLAIDFCTDEKSILSKENLFTEYKRLEGRRIFQEGENHDRQCGKGRYSIRSRAIQELSSNFICVLDHMYRISLYNKIDKSFGKEVIVSFHENNKRGIAKENNMIQNKPDYLVPVFADEICARFLC